MAKRKKNTPNADLIALLTSIREQIDETFDDYGVDPDDGEDDCGDDGEDDNGDDD